MSEVSGVCYICKNAGHWAASCPENTAPADTSKPSWCGACDPRTRLLDLASCMARCPACHPLAWQPLHQHKRCGGCRQLVYAWDQQPCGSHQELLGPVLQNR